jgi:hypothetical protein
MVRCFSPLQPFMGPTAGKDGPDQTRQGLSMEKLQLVIETIYSVFYLHVPILPMSA